MRRTLATSVVLFGWLFTGCVAQQLAEVEEAEAAYARCVAERGEEDDECQLLAERKKAAQGRYEGDARRRWGCDPLQEECPTVR